MRTETRTIYTLAELKEHKPKGYAAVLARWEKELDDDPDVPWMEEIMDSLKAVVKACGAKLDDWSVGPYGQSFARVTVDDPDEEETDPRDVAWLVSHVLKPNGYVDEEGEPYFPGLCAWTGVCFDDDMIEAVYKSMKDGESLTEALEGLAGRAEDIMEKEVEYRRTPEAMEDDMAANWSDNEYDEHGEEV